MKPALLCVIAVLCLAAEPALAEPPVRLRVHSACPDSMILVGRNPRVQRLVIRVACREVYGFDEDGHRAVMTAHTWTLDCTGVVFRPAQIDSLGKACAAPFERSLILEVLRQYLVSRKLEGLAGQRPYTL